MKRDLQSKVPKGNIAKEIVFDTSNFILNALMSTTLMKHIKESKDNNYMIFVQTTNIAVDFYNALDFNDEKQK